MTVSSAAADSAPRVLPAPGNDIYRPYLLEEIEEIMGRIIVRTTVAWLHAGTL